MWTTFTVALTAAPTPSEPRDWYDVPGVRVVGAVLGILLVVAAIRRMFGKR